MPWRQYRYLAAMQSIVSGGEFNADQIRCGKALERRSSRGAAEKGQRQGGSHAEPQSRRENQTSQSRSQAETQGVLLTLIFLCASAALREDGF